MAKSKEEAGRSGLGVALGSLDYFGHRKDRCHRWQGTRFACFRYVAVSVCGSGGRLPAEGGQVIGPST